VTRPDDWSRIADPSEVAEISADGSVATPTDAVEGAEGVRSGRNWRIPRPAGDSVTCDPGRHRGECRITVRDLRKPEARRLVDAYVTADTGR
jgi:hypothetical protein